MPSIEEMRTASVDTAMPGEPEESPTEGESPVNEPPIHQALRDRGADEEDLQTLIEAREQGLITFDNELEAAYNEQSLPAGDHGELGVIPIKTLEKVQWPGDEEEADTGMPAMGGA